MSPVCEQVASALSCIPQAIAAARDAASEATYWADPQKVVNEPYALVAKAATGDLDAQRDAADLAMLFVVNGLEADPFVTLSEGLMFARMAASRGDTADITRLVFMLSLAGSIATDMAGAEIAGEMIAMLEILADRGDEASAELLANSTGNETTETLQLAQDARARIKDAWGF